MDSIDQKSKNSGGFPEKVYISTYGCQMNDHDTERMYSLLEKENYLQAVSPEDADIIVINSCSVREKPVHKVRSEVGKYRNLKTLKPHLKIGVGGCVGQQEGAKLVGGKSLLDFVFGTDTIDLLPEILSDVKSSRKPVVKTRMGHRDEYKIKTLVRNAPISANVTITKGCDNFCTFCVVPFTRGRERSRLMDEIIKDIQDLVSRGTREVTLLGQNVNSYKSPDGSGSFNDLLRAVCDSTEVERVRYMTSHPKDFNDELIAIHGKYKNKLGMFIHLPVQSGSDIVLERMNRGYTAAEYLEKVRKLKECLPYVALSTDIIVGFPGETDEDFSKTMKLLREVEYENIYAFKYSPRPFTKAAQYEEQVPEDVKDRRLQEINEFQKELNDKIMGKYVNNEYDILIEKQCANGMMAGKNVFFKTVQFEGAHRLLGQTMKVKINGGLPFAMRGELLG